MAGPAIGQFEMKRVETEKGELEFQSQNALSWGMPRRAYQPDGAGDFLYDDNSLVQQRYALELEYSWTDFFRTRVGIEFEKERVDDPNSFSQRNAFDSLSLTEIAGEAVVVLVPVRENKVGLAWLVEYEYALDRDESDSLTYGPLIEYNTGPWRFLANLYLVSFLGGERVEPSGRRDEKLDFAYAAQAKYKLSEKLSLALEAYGTVDRLGSTGVRSEESLLFGDHDQHRMGPVLYYSFGLGKKSAAAQKLKLDDGGIGGMGGSEETKATLGLGFLAGLNENTPDATLKLSLEIEF
jgi:hypothetical protein